MLRLMKLESRIVLDGAGMAEAADHAHEHDAAPAEAAHDAAPEHVAEARGHGWDHGDAAAQAVALMADPVSDASPMDVVLIADDLSDPEQLAAAAGPDAAVIIYDADAESPEAVMERVAALARETGRPIGSVSILSHGENGGFRLGNDTIDADSLAAHSEAWAKLEGVLSDNAGIHIYGCNVSGGDNALLNGLADATGADVFASDDATGADGDWDLEAASDGAGADSDGPFDMDRLADYPGSLAEPVISGNPPASVVQDGLYTFTPTATDPDGVTDIAGFTISKQPEWASFDPTTGTLTGTPGNAHVGDYTGIEIGVYDSQGNISKLAPFTITVVNVNDAPTISGAPPNNVQEGTDFSFTPVAADVDLREGVDPQEKLTFSIDGKPEWAIFDTATGRLYGTAPLGMAGTVHNNITITVRDNDGVQATLGPFSITVTELNNQPEISGQPPTEVDEDSEYSFTPVASDMEDGPADLRFSISNQPMWANFDPATGRLWGTPDNEDVGAYENIRVTVTDSGGLTAALAPFSITVNNVNDPPEISGRPADRIQEGIAYNFVPTVVDPDHNETLTFTIDNKPNWATFDAATGRLSGTPEDADVGIYEGVTITVTDSGGESDAITFNVQVMEVNESPTISGDPDRSVLEDQEYVFRPQSSDPDGDAVEFSISNQPSWATFDPATGELRGVPTNDHVGHYQNILITVTDETGLSASLSSFSIEVINVNDAPSITGTSTQTVQAQEGYSFIPTVTDVDLRVDPTERLHYSIEGKPAWAQFNAQTGELSGTPTNADIGTTGPITITVTDEGGLTDQMIFTIRVVPLNTPPTIEGDPDTHVYQGQTYSFTPTGVSDNEDAVGDLRFSVSNKPSWVIFNEQTGEMTGVPANDDVGIYRNIVITVTDTGGLSTSLPAFDLIVYNVNDAPDIISEAQKRVRIGANYEFIPTGFDPDQKPTGGDDLGIVNPQEELTFSFEGLPTWITEITDDNGRIYGVVDMEAVLADLASGLAHAPADGEASVIAVYDIAITVTDAGIHDPRLLDARQINPAVPLSATYAYQLRILAPGPGITAPENIDYVENQAPVGIGDVVLEAGGSDIDHVEVRITDNYQSDADGQDMLLFNSMTFDSGHVITGAWSADTGVLRLVGNATAAEYQQALRAIRFDHAGGVTGDGDDPIEAVRTITFTVVDVNGQTDTASMGVAVDAVNDAPVLTPENCVIDYTGNERLLPVFPNANIQDVDDLNMRRAVVQITGNYVNGEDVLHFNDSGFFGITATWNAADGTLTLDGLAGKDTYEAALKAIAYENTAGTPTEGARTISVTITDANSGGDGFTQARNLAPGVDPGGPKSDTSICTLNVFESHPYRPPYEPPAIDGLRLLPLTPPEGLGQQGVPLGALRLPGDVQDTGRLMDMGFRTLGAPCGQEELYECCTLEEALRIGCRLAPAIDSEARLCNVTWGYLEGLGMTDPFVSSIEPFCFTEFDLFHRLFMRQDGDPGFSVEPGAFAEAFNMAEEVEWARYNRDEEHDVFTQLSMQGAPGFNDAGPGELKAAFMGEGPEGLDRPGRWRPDGGDPGEC